MQFEKRRRIAILTRNRHDWLNAIGIAQDCFDLIDAIVQIGADRKSAPPSLHPRSHIAPWDTIDLEGRK
jgi:hypothetical protein